MVEKDKQLLICMKKCLKNVWAVDDKNNWPVKLNSISHLFAAELYKKIFESFNVLKKRGYDFKMISSCFNSATSILRSMDVITRGFVLEGARIDERRTLICDLLKCAQNLKEGSIFNEDGHNILNTQSKIDEELQKLQVCSGIEEALKIQKLCGLIRSYLEIIYFRAYDMAQEVHGPYETENGYILIREYRNMAPKNIWPEKKMIEYKTIKIVTEYMNESKVVLDPYNHLWHEGAPLYDSMTKYSLFVDDHQYTILKVDDIIHNFQDVIIQNRMTDLNDWRYYAKKYARIYNEKFEKLFTEANQEKTHMTYIFEQIDKGEQKYREDIYFKEVNIKMMLNILF